jgi:Helix-turn-helix domain
LAKYDDITAAELADLLSHEIFDADDAARFLGLARNSIEYAAYRKRIAYVQYGAKKLFTRKDLLEYASKRGRGRDSKLEETPHFVAKE